MSTKWSIKTLGPTIPSQYTDKRLEDDKDYGLYLFNPSPNTSKKWLDTEKWLNHLHIFWECSQSWPKPNGGTSIWPNEPQHTLLVGS